MNYLIIGSSGDEAWAASLPAAQLAARTLVEDDGNEKAVVLQVAGEPDVRWIGAGRMVNWTPTPGSKAPEIRRYHYVTTQGRR